jgi:hypothetical protein
VLGVGIDREAEERQLQDRDPDHHEEGQTVPPHLNKLLADDGAKSMAGEAMWFHEPPADVPAIK